MQQVNSDIQFADNDKLNTRVGQHGIVLSAIVPGLTSFAQLALGHVSLLGRSRSD